MQSQSEKIAEPLLLALETAGSACSAAVMRGPGVLAADSRPLRHGHAELLLPMIDRVMAEARLRPRQLQMVAAAAGPGGFTGIRVGLAAAHGIALATGADLRAISNFAAVAAAFDADAAEPGRVVLVALDSRRADLYVQLFASSDADSTLVPLAAPEAVLPERLADYAAELMPPAGASGPVWIAGDAAEAAAAALDRRLRCAVAPRTAPDAFGIGIAALRQLRHGAVSEPARPLYLRPPDVTLPRRSATPAPPVR